MVVERVVTVAASRARVWEILTDVERWPSWTRSMTSLERLDEGALRVGSVTRIHQPKLAPMDWTVIELVEETSFTWRAHTTGMVLTAGHEITGVDGALEVRLYASQDGVLGTLARPLTKSLTRRYLNYEAEGLRERAENL